MNNKFRRGTVYWANLDPTTGSEIRKKRPCVLIGVDPVNFARRTVIIVPLSTSAREYPPVTIKIRTNAGKHSVAVCDQIRAIDKSRLVEKLGMITEGDMEKIVNSVKEIIGG